MDVPAMSSVGSLTSESTVLDEEDDRAFIEISELDRLLGLPPPRFDLGAADIDPQVLSSDDNGNGFESEIEFALPQKLGLPQRLRIDLDHQSESETEVCYNKDFSKVSVKKTELNLGSNGREVESSCYLIDPVPVTPSTASGQDEMLYKRSKPRGKSGDLNRVVSKLLAKGDSSDDSILQSLLLDPIPTPALAPIRVCDKPKPVPVPKITNPVPSNSLPSPVINRLKKLGTSVEIEQSEPLVVINGQNYSTEPQTETYLQIMESLDKAVGLTSDLTKKKKRKTEKKSSNNQVPSNLKLLAEIDNSDNLTKFSFQVDAKQVIELPEGQKLYTCDICSGVYHRGFSLKRHYLKTHINYKHISKRDLHNCGILFDPSIEKGGARKKQLIKEDSPPVVSNLSPPCDIPDLYRCHTCGKCFMLISDLKTHLMEHPPVSVQNLNEDQFKNYTCTNCKARYQKKKLFLRHQEMCGKEIAEPEPEEITIHYCLYCEKSFPTFLLKKKHHLQMHHPKKRLHQCYLCKTKMFKERLGVFKHLLLHHRDEYIGCLSCKLRFGTREEYKKHNKENHKSVGTGKKILFHEQLTAKNEGEEESVEWLPQPEETREVTDNINNPNLTLKCTECPKMFACYLYMTRHRRIAHRLKKKKKVLKKETVFNKVSDHRKTPTPPLLVLTPPPARSLPLPPSDPEVLFYSTIAHNIRENLTHHLDGKLDSQEVMEFDLNKASASTETNKVLNFSASFTSPAVPTSQPEASSTPVQQKELRPIPISPRAPWEKFNFPKNYDGRCGLTSYIKDMSHLDISTQLTMRRNLQRLNSTSGQESNKESPANIPAGLLLVEKPVPDCAEAFGEPDIGKPKGEGAPVLSGEWVRPRTFLCSVCGFKSQSLWDVEDHKYAQHPNVWVPHVEIVGEQSGAWDWFYHRRLPPETEVVQTTPALPPLPLPCSKCGRHCLVLADLHLHMLECGGDTSWQSLVGASGGRRRKWRPFGSRRRKHQGRHGLKRNIPNTPAKHVCGRIRTKPGDMDTIQKMIANLPAKRVTRRVIGDDPDIKTRSQATISSVPISSLATHSSAARHSAIKASKFVKPNSKIHNQKKVKTEHFSQECKIRSKDEVKIKEEPIDDIVIIKEENIEKYFQPLEAENTVQHSDILTSLQMIRVVRTSTEEKEPEKERIIEEGPIETSKILAAMREAMLDSTEKTENRAVIKPLEKIKEKRKRSKVGDKNIKVEPSSESKKSNRNDGEVIICNGCGMQFDNVSACQRHKKKCVYWKEDKTSEDTKTNNCSHCGSVFPYLMALLKHKCSKLEVSEEPVMPELCPEKPVEEVQGDSVEDIPILSPVEVSRDDSYCKRISLIEATLSEVGRESFDVSPYHEKYFKSVVSKENVTPSVKQKTDELLNKSGISGDKMKDLSSKNTNRSPDLNNHKLEKQFLNASETSDTCINSQSSITHADMTQIKSPSSTQNSRNIKVSEMFKEIKRRRGRKRLKTSVKIANKILATKKGLRNLGLASSSTLTKKKNNRKKRSSNFVMLMKEWEKLQKEGAVAIGKRKRMFSNSETSFRPLRLRRKMVAPISSNDYADIDSVISDISDIQDFEDIVQCSSRRSSRRTNSIGSISDIHSSILQESSGNCSVIPSENIKLEESYKEHTSKKRRSSECLDITKAKNEHNPSMTVKEEPSSENVVVFKRKPGRPPRSKSTGAIDQNVKHLSKSESLNNEQSSNKKKITEEIEFGINVHLKVEKEDTSLQSESQPQTVLPKRKPGRPRFKSMTEETEQHIREAIDNIVKRTMECNISEHSSRGHLKESNIFERKIFDGDTTFPKFPEPPKTVSSVSEDALSKHETDDHIQEAIESVLSQSHDAIAISREVDWAKIDEIIYNVSIGGADVFPDLKTNAVCSNTLNSTQALARKRRRKRKKVFTKFLKRSQKPDITGNHEEKSIDCIDSSLTSYNESGTSQEKNNKSEVKKSLVVSNNSDNTEVIRWTDSRKLDDSQTLDLKKKHVKTSKEEQEASTSSKPKEIKTKQLSIEDYLTISHFVKGSNIDPIKANRNVELESKTETVCIKVSNNDCNASVVDAMKEVIMPKGSPKVTENCKRISKQSLQRKPLKHNKTENEVIINDKPSSPGSTSSKEDLALSVIRNKAIKKKKKLLKLKKMLKSKHYDLMDSKLSKLTKPKLAFREEKKRGKKKKIKVGVSRNLWEVSVVENKSNVVELLCDEEPRTTTIQPSQSTVTETTKKFYCSICDVRFESSYNLYEHQLTAEHNLKSTVAAVNQSNLSEENDPVKYCKSIGNIINDLEKRTLNVAKVMHHLKQRDPTDGVDGNAPANTAVVESTTSPTKEEWRGGHEEWGTATVGEWWEGAQQALEMDPGTTSSLGSLMVDTVNKLLSSDQDVMSDPPYSLSDLQQAMGASDEEMAMLFQLGEHSLQEEYVYDNSRPAEEGPTLMDLDHQSGPPATHGPAAAVLSLPDSLLEVRKQEPLSDSEDTKTCRGGVVNILGEYESREMVCPTCNKHFLGLPALQTHVAWSHCGPVGNTAKLKRRALLCSEDVDRRLVCFVCKEIVPTAAQLEAHIQAQHTKKSDETHEQVKPTLSEAAEKLKSKMSTALGGLVDRALNKLLGNGKAFNEPTTSQNQPTQADLNTGALQLLGRLCAARKRVGNENMKLSAETLQLLGRLRAVNHKDDSISRPYSNLAEEMRAILARGRPVGVSKGALQASVNSGANCSAGSSGSSVSTAELKPTNLLDHLAVCSSDVQERPYACPICDLRFLIPSTRNRHIARAHGKYGRRYDEELEESHNQDDLDNDWKSSMDTDMDANDDGEMLPLCSDCGLSFQSIHEVMRHRIEDHPRRFSAEGFQEEETPNVSNKNTVVESSSEIKETSETPTNYVKLLPVSDNAIDSTSTVRKKRGRPPKLPEFKTDLKRKCPDLEKKFSPNRKSYRSLGRKKKQLNEDEEMLDTSKDYTEEESFYESSREETSNVDSNSPETDKSSDRLSEKHASRTSSEENLAELSKKLDRRKVRMGNMAEEAVRVKAEAALRELSLAKKQKSPSSAAKWGINAVKFTKQSSTGISSSQLNGSPSKPRFASLSEKKWKIPAGSGTEPQALKVEPIDRTPDVYDFRDEELEINKKPFQQFKDSQSPDSEYSESNKLAQSNTWNVSGSPRKVSLGNKLNTDNS